MDENCEDEGKSTYSVKGLCCYATVSSSLKGKGEGVDTSRSPINEAKKQWQSYILYNMML